MNIQIHSSVDGATNATGIVVIIDVLRACTTIPILLKQGVNEIIPVKTPEEAAKFKKDGYILIGEGQHGHVHNVFEFNNSPSEIINKPFEGRKVVLRSNNATQAIHHAKQASEIVLASFVNVNAIAKFIFNHRLSDVTLVALGRLGKKSIEDELCAEVIKKELEGTKYHFEEIKKNLYNCETALLVRETLKRPQDVDLALMLNSYEVVPKVDINSNKKTIKAG